MRKDQEPGGVATASEGSLLELTLSSNFHYKNRDMRNRGVFRENAQQFLYKCSSTAMCYFFAQVIIILLKRSINMNCTLGDSPEWRRRNQAYFYHDFILKFSVWLNTSIKSILPHLLMWLI